MQPIEQILAQSYRNFGEPLPPEVGRLHLIVLQSIVLLYFFIMSVLFTCHTGCKPQISASHKHLRREKLKFWVIWFPFVLAMVIIEILTIIQTLKMLNFCANWLQTLQNLKDSYSCTYTTL